MAISLSGVILQVSSVFHQLLKAEKTLTEGACILLRLELERYFSFSTCSINNCKNMGKSAMERSEKVILMECRIPTMGRKQKNHSS